MQSTHTLLKKWISTGASDLLQGAYIIARFQYPDLQLQDVEKPRLIAQEILDVMLK